MNEVEETGSSRIAAAGGPESRPSDEPVLGRSSGGAKAAVLEPFVEPVQAPAAPVVKKVEPAAPVAAAPTNIGIAHGLRFRQDERYEVDGLAEVIVIGDTGNSLLRGRILDISTSGCYIQTVARLPIRPETEVAIDFAVYGYNFRVKAKSRFAKSKVGAGFRFLAMDESTRRRLHLVLADIRSKLIEKTPDGSVPVVERNTFDA